MRNVLWIDDSPSEREAAQRMLSGIDGVNCVVADSSREAEVVMSSRRIDCIVTDILRRSTDGDVSSDDGYAFFRDVVRPARPTLPVISHTKNLPTSFAVGAYSQYLSKWEPEDKKTIELEPRISEAVTLYDAFAHEAVWARIEPRLVRVHGDILSRLQKWADVWRLNPQQFEQVVAELLNKMGFDVLWIPGGKTRASISSRAAARPRS